MEQEQEVDAFGVLLSSQTPSKRRRSNQQGSYSHPGETQRGNSSSPQQQPAGLPHKAAAAAAVPDALQQQPLLSPRRQQRLPPDEFRAMVSAGWDRALKNIPGALEEHGHASTQPTQQPQPTQAQHKAPMQSPRAGRLAAAAAGDGAAVDAFAVLRSAQASQVPMDAELFLEGRADGRWLWHWRLAGAPWASSTAVPEPCWSATINANLPRQQQPTAGALNNSGSGGGSGSSSKAVPTGSTKLRLLVSTNIPPGFGGAVDWDSPLLCSNGLGLDAAGQQGDPTDQPLGGYDEGPAWQQQQQQGVGGASSGSRWRGGGPGVLISALQKSVRRGYAGPATKIALELLKEPKTAEALARRLSIVCLEDGLLHPQLPLVVWAMLALGKGYVVGGHLANALLSITHQMASITLRDFMPGSLPAAPAAGVYTAPATWHAVDAALGISSLESVLVKSILIRAAYGGMAGDKSMLLTYAGLWTARFSGCTLPPPAPPPPPAVEAAAAGQQERQDQQQQQLKEQLQDQQQQQSRDEQQLQDQQRDRQPSPDSAQPCARGVQQQQQQTQPADEGLAQEGQLRKQQPQQQLSQPSAQQVTPLSSSAPESEPHEQLHPRWLQQQPQQQEQQPELEPLQLGPQHQQARSLLQPTQLESTQQLNLEQAGQQPGALQQHAEEGAAVTPQQQQQGLFAQYDGLHVLQPAEEQPQPADTCMQDPECAQQAGSGPGSSDSLLPRLGPQPPSQHNGDSPMYSPEHLHPGATPHTPPDAVRSASPGDAGPSHSSSSQGAAGRSGSAPTAAAPSSSWLAFLQQHYSRLQPQEPCRVTLVGPVTRDDIPLAAVDFHVAPALTQHLKEQPQLKAAVRGMIATSPAVAARLSGPDGFEGLINSALWHLRSSLNRKAWMQLQYLQAAGAGCCPDSQLGGQSGGRQQLQAAAVAAVAAWSRAGHVTAQAAAADGSRACADAPPGASTVQEEQQRAAQLGAQLPPGTGFSEGALQVLEMELSCLAAFEAEQRRVRQELMPLWKGGLAVLADEWCKEFLSRRVY